MIQPRIRLLAAQPSAERRASSVSQPTTFEASVERPGLVFTCRQSRSVIATDAISDDQIRRFGGPSPKSLAALTIDFGLSHTAARSGETSKHIGVNTEARVEIRETMRVAPTNAANTPSQQLAENDGEQCNTHKRLNLKTARQIRRCIQ